MLNQHEMGALLIFK